MLYSIMQYICNILHHCIYSVSDYSMLSKFGSNDSGVYLVLQYAPNLETVVTQWLKLGLG